jgi:hypothetical protein
MKGLLIAVAFFSLSLSLSAKADITTKDPLPTKILACGGGLISQIAGRLEGDTDFSSGTSVDLTNGGHMVSYEKIDPIVKSRVGDHVLICLVFIPKNCPAGDVRGRMYTTTNLRTLESWTLGDSEHLCGGA